MNFTRALITHSIGLLLVGLLCTYAGAEEVPLSFVTRVQIDLCPEYPEGGVALDLGYRVGSDPTVKAAEVVAQSINQSENTATVDVRLPSFFGSTPFHLSAICRNAKGFGAVSNIVSFSNCDRIAELDSDGDGIPNNLEDTNCDNFFSPGDRSNPHNVDTDGDGVRDLVELLAGTDPSNPGSSPRPSIYSSSVFDPDGDSDANAAAWRGASGTWYVRDFVEEGSHIAFQFGLPGDIPFFYQPEGDAATSNVGVIRRLGNDYLWYFRGPGFRRADASAAQILQFGIFGDNIIPGPWEQEGVTNPAIARLFNNAWTFLIYQKDGSVKSVVWGGNGDIPKPQDFDGDGILDVAVFRPSEQKTYWISSSTGLGHIEEFGSGTAEHTVRGDFSGDGKEEITVWEPISGMYSSMLSDQGFDEALTQAKDPEHYFEMQLGLYIVHLPLNWNRREGVLLYTVVDHALGLRYWREGNDPNGKIISEQWGLPGDHLG